MKKFSGIITVFILASCCCSYAFEDDINKLEADYIEYIATAE